MYGRDDIRFVDTRHEEGAAFMAYNGEARAQLSRPIDSVFLGPCFSEKEIADANWYRPDDLPMIPPGMSIARTLIDAWVARSEEQ